MIAAANGRTAAAEWLLQHGVDVHAVSDHGMSALHTACGLDNSDHCSMVELLLANGADVNKSAQAQLTALDLAVEHGSVQCAKVLIAAGAAVNQIDKAGFSHLHTAIIKRHSAVVQLLLEQGATAVINSVVPAICPRGGHCCSHATALMMCKKPDEVKLLLAAGSDVHVTNDLGDTCLHTAAKHKLPAPVLCLLIKAGTDLHAVNNDGQTAAQLAHNRGYTLIEQLLNRAAQQS
jgi:ankyrin repeat protein